MTEGSNFTRGSLKFDEIKLDVHVGESTEERDFIVGYNTANTTVDTLMLVFHGSGAGENLTVIGTTFTEGMGVVNKLNDTSHKLVIVYLGGTNGSAGRVWNVGGLSDSTSDDLAFVNAVIDYLSSSRSPVPLNLKASGFEVVGQGFSQGSLVLLNKIAPNVDFFKRIVSGGSQFVKKGDTAFSYIWTNSGTASKYSLQYWHGYNDAMYQYMVEIKI